MHLALGYYIPDYPVRRKSVTSVVRVIASVIGEFGKIKHDCKILRAHTPLTAYNGAGMKNSRYFLSSIA